MNGLKVTGVYEDRIVVSGQGSDIVVKLDGEGLTVIALRYDKTREVSFEESPCWPTTVLRIDETGLQ